MSMSQGEAVFQAVTAVFTVDGVAVPQTSTWSAAQKEQVYGMVFNFFKSGETTHKNNPDDAGLKKYIPGLVNNWVRKDTRLNGGTKYETKKPGSRMGSGDAVLKNMRVLLSVTEDSDAKLLIQAEIDKRIESLKPKTEINVEALPEALRHLVG